MSSWTTIPSIRKKLPPGRGHLTFDLIFFDTTNTYFEMDDPGNSELLTFGIKDVYASEDSGERRFVVAFNPEQAKHDKHGRKRKLERIKAERKVMGKLPENSFSRQSRPCLPIGPWESQGTEA